MAIFDADERDSFRRSVERFVADRCTAELQRAAAASEDGFDRQIWRDIAELGWLALSLPVDHGGLGGGAREEAIVMRAIGSGLMSEPLLASVILGGGLLAAQADAALKDELLPSLAGGRLLLAFADVDGAIATIAAPDASDWHLTGTKRTVLHGDVAQSLLVSAKVGMEQALFLVDPASEGVKRTTACLIDDRRIVDLSLDHVMARRIGTGDATAAIAMVRDRATAAICAEAIGAMSALLQQTLDHARTRKQFGVAIGSFQIIQHRLVDMLIAVQEAEAITAVAADALDAAHPDADRIVAAAKIRVNRAAKHVGEAAIQMHGGIGLTAELAAGRYFKRLLVLASLFGDCDEHLDRLSA